MGVVDFSFSCCGAGRIIDVGKPAVGTSDHVRGNTKKHGQKHSAAAVVASKFKTSRLQQFSLVYVGCRKHTATVKA